jgi:hypothetical protein
MKDDEYWYAVDQVIEALSSVNVDPRWRTDVVDIWRNVVAPKKHNEYGIECWERMGTQALVCDISAVFYRYKRLKEIGETKGTPMYNVHLDSFGYAVIYTVCKYQELFIDGWVGPTLDEIFELAQPVDLEERVFLTNETILRVGWEDRMMGYVEALAMRQAYNMWRGLPV